MTGTDRKIEKAKVDQKKLDENWPQIDWGYSKRKAEEEKIKECEYLSGSVVICCNHPKVLLSKPPNCKTNCPLKSDTELKK